MKMHFNLSQQQKNVNISTFKNIIITGFTVSLLIRGDGFVSQKKGQLKNTSFQISFCFSFIISGYRKLLGIVHIPSSAARKSQIIRAVNLTQEIEIEIAKVSHETRTIHKNDVEEANA